MPFRKITSIIHEGLIDSDELLVVHTTCGKRICAVGRTSTDVKTKRFLLHYKHWPVPVKREAGLLQQELRTKGNPVELSDITAWVDTKYGLVVSQSIHIDLKVEGRNASRSLVLRGVVTG